MYLVLHTHQTWRIRDEIDAAKFFQSLPILLAPDDFILIGTYEPSDATLAWLTQNHVTIDLPKRDYGDSFDMNREEHPRGAAFTIPAGREQIDGLVTLAADPQGSRDKPLFCDHVAAFRASTPFLSLINFHDAWYGGDLHLSGLYSAELMRKFADAIGVDVTQVDNPEWANWTQGEYIPAD